MIVGIRYFVLDYEFPYRGDVEAQAGGFHHTIHGGSG
jgi:hypothetical protein